MLRSFTHSSLVFIVCLYSDDVGRLDQRNIKKNKAFKKDQACCDFTGRTPESGLFYLCPVNTKPLGLYLLLQALQTKILL